MCLILLSLAIFGIFWTKNVIFNIEDSPLTLSFFHVNFSYGKKKKKKIFSYGCLLYYYCVVRLQCPCLKKLFNVL